VSGSEIAFFSLGPDDLKDLKAENTRSSKRIIELKDKPRTLLATILISNNFINIGIVLLSDQILWRIFGNDVFASWAKSILITYPFLSISQDGLTRGINFAITVVGVTFLLVLFGEVMPKIYARFNNMTLAKFMSSPILFLRRLFWPVSRLLVGWSGLIERRLGGGSYASSYDHRSEIQQAIDLTVTPDIDSTTEVDILKSIIKFSEVTTKQIIRSRVDVIAADTEMNYSKLLELIRQSGYSRIPVYEDDFDHIKGILYAKDLISHLQEKNDFQWQQLIRSDVLYVPETKRINELLKEFQEKRLHMAIVVDEFGGSSGIVTLEDVMEEVIGEIKDEFDQEEELDYLQLDESNFIFEGKTQLNDVCRIIGVDTRTFDHLKGESDTIAGLMLEVLGKIPRMNQELKLKKFVLKALSVTTRRVEKVKITLL
jgi:gliding motility-associated protein GldE